MKKNKYPVNNDQGEDFKRKITTFKTGSEVGSDAGGTARDSQRKALVAPVQEQESEHEATEEYDAYNPGVSDSDGIDNGPTVGQIQTKRAIDIENQEVEEEK